MFYDRHKKEKIMVLNKRDLITAFSPTKGRKKRRSSHGTSLNKVQSMSVMSSTQNEMTKDVKVFIRIRPFNEKEKNENKNNRSTIKVIDDKLLVFDPKAEDDPFYFRGQVQKCRDLTKKANKNMEFIFDKVFTPDATNQEVHECTTKSIVSSLLDGFNCSVFVYGATGAGKTHTMLGNKNNPGITFLTMVELHEQVEKFSESKDFDLRVSYLEVYNEIVYDLLQSKFTPLYLRDDGANSLLVSGLKIVQIQNAAELFEMLEYGNKNRTQHPTDSNAESSRSHAVFQVYVKMCSKETTETKFAKLSMIDLAGSERGSATGCAGSRFKEGSNINKSLLALGNCINNLADGLKHIPYRDSKLTRILKDSIGGNCQTVMIANVSPSTLSYEDTYNTLKYASRAKKIKTKFTKNVSAGNMRVEHYVKLVEELRKENMKLKGQIKTMEIVGNKPQGKITLPIADPIQVKKMDTLLAEKMKLETKLLSLESQKKTLDWRVRHNYFIATLFGTDNMGENSRVQRTIKQLEARSSSMDEKIQEVLKEYRRLNQNFNSYLSNVEESKSKNMLKNKLDTKSMQIQMAKQNVINGHHQKLLLMQDKRLCSNDLTINNLSNLNSKLYSVLRGHNLVTSSLDSEYQGTVSMLRGVKGVTWNDIDDDVDEDDRTFNPTSVKSFMNLTILNSPPEVAIVPKCTEEENVPSLNSTLTLTSPTLPGSELLKLQSSSDSSNSSPVVNAPFEVNIGEKENINILTSNLKTKLEIDPQKPEIRKLPKLQSSSGPSNSSSILKAPLKVNMGEKENVNILTSNIKNKMEIDPRKPDTIRRPLNALKMTRTNSRFSRLHHPYVTPRSGLGITRNMKSINNFILKIDKK